MTPEEQQQAATAAGQSGNLTPTQIAQIVAQSVQQSMPQQPQPQMTEEQLDQMFATYRPTEALVEALFGETANPQTRLQAFMEMTQGLIRNAGHHAAYIADGRMQDLYQKIQDPLEDARHLGNERFFTQLYDGHDGLRTYDAMIKHILPQVTSQQGYPQDRGQRPQWVREQLTNILKQYDPNFDPKKGPTPQPQGQAFQNGNPFGGNGAQFPGNPMQTNTQPQRAGSLPSLGGGGQGPAAVAPKGVSGDSSYVSVKEATGGHGF